MVDVDRMIGRLCQLVQDADFPSALCRRREHREPELLAADSLRARECKQDAAFGKFLHCLEVEFLVTPQGVTQRTPVFGESRRVKHDKVVVPISHFVEKLEGILRERFVSGVSGEIQAYVGVGQCYGFL